MLPFDAAKPRTKTKSPAMSLERALFEEEQEVLALIGAKSEPLPPAPPPIGSTRSGSVSRGSMLGPAGSLNSKSGRSSSVAGGVKRREFEGLLSTQGYQFGVATSARSRAADVSGARRKSAPAPDHHRRSSSPVPRPIGLGPPASMSPPQQLPSFDKAYRRLSNAAMAQSTGSLSRLGQQSPRPSLSQENAVRLEKDKDLDSAIESSSDDDTGTDTSRPTSRTQSPSLRPSNRSGGQDELWVETRHDHTPLSLSAAADQESISIFYSILLNGRSSSSIHRRSLFGPWSPSSLLSQPKTSPGPRSFQTQTNLPFHKF